MIPRKLFTKQIVFCVPTLLLFSLLTAATCDRDKKTPIAVPESIVTYAKNIKLNEKEAMRDLQILAAAPHPFGSLHQGNMSRYLQKRIKELGFELVVHDFKAATPNPEALRAKNRNIPLTVEKQGQNIFAVVKTTAKPSCAIVLASHYDTKDIPGIAFRGANDGGSSSLLLLQALRAVREYSQKKPFRCHVIGAWFDGEESVLPEWRDGQDRHPARIVDNTYGSRNTASRLMQCDEKMCLPQDLSGLPLEALVVLDMLGSPTLAITRDLNSHPRLVTLLESAAATLFSEPIMSSRPLPIEDDHLPFRDRGIAVLNIIDFENLDHWHQEGDVPEKVSPASLEKALRLGTSIVLTLAAAQE